MQHGWRCCQHRYVSNFSCFFHIFFSSFCWIYIVCAAQILRARARKEKKRNQQTQKRKEKEKNKQTKKQYEAKAKSKKKLTDNHPSLDLRLDLHVPHPPAQHRPYLSSLERIERPPSSNRDCPRHSRTPTGAFQTVCRQWTRRPDGNQGHDAVCRPAQVVGH